MIYDSIEAFYSMLFHSIPPGLDKILSVKIFLHYHSLPISLCFSVSLLLLPCFSWHTYIYNYILFSLTITLSLSFSLSLSLSHSLFVYIFFLTKWYLFPLSLSLLLICHLNIFEAYSSMHCVTKQIAESHFLHQNQNRHVNKYRLCMEMTRVQRG